MAPPMGDLATFSWFASSERCFGQSASCARGAVDSAHHKHRRVRRRRRRDKSSSQDTLQKPWGSWGSLVLCCVLLLCSLCKASWCFWMPLKDELSRRGHSRHEVFAQCIVYSDLFEDGFVWSHRHHMCNVHGRLLQAMPPMALTAAASKFSLP